MNIIFKNYKRLFFGVFLAILFLFPAGQTFAGFGISPPKLLNKNLVPGSQYEQIIYLVQSKPDITLNAEVTVNAGNINSWITIENGTSFKIPKGQTQFPMKIKVNVPQDAAFGSYKGTITINTSSDSSNSGAVKIALGAQVDIDLEVTSRELYDFSIQRFLIDDTEKGSNLKLVLKIQNKGNTPAGPSKVSAVIFDKYHGQQLAQYEADFSEKVGPFETKDIFAELIGSNSLEVGQYWADFEIFDGEKSLTKDKVVFNVVPEGSLKSAKGQGKINLEWLSTKWPWLILLAVLVVAAAVATTVFLLRKKRKNKDGGDKSIHIKINKGPGEP